MADWRRVYNDTPEPSFTMGVYTGGTPVYTGTQTSFFFVDASGNLKTSSLAVSPSILRAGTNSAAATALVLSSSTSVSKVTIQASFSNGYYTVVGNSTQQPFRLEAGESLDLNVDNLNKIYFKSGTTIGSGTVAVGWVAS